MQGCNMTVSEPVSLLPALLSIPDYNRYSQLTAARWLAQPGPVSPPDCHSCDAQTLAHTNTRQLVVVDFNVT